MLNNNLSNYSAPMLLFSFERVVCEQFEKKRFRGVKYKVNKQNVNAINHLFKKDFRIYYVTFDVPKNKLDELEEELEWQGCLFNGLIKVGDTESLRTLLRTNEGNYYDTEIGIINPVGTRYAHKWENYLTGLWNS